MATLLVDPPDLMLIDEALRPLDPPSRRHALESLTALAPDHQLVVVDHDASGLSLPSGSLHLHVTAGEVAVAAR